MQYWYRDGKVYAIRFFHTGETFVFTLGDGQLAAELVGQRQVRMEFSAAERSRLEAIARDGAGNNRIFQQFVGETE